MTQKINQILKEIRTNENGSASVAMTEMGLQYKKNHGVGIASLTEIAKKYTGDSKLAKELRSIDIRETKLLGIMIEDPEKIDSEEINIIVQNISNIELAEQTCIQLLEKIPYCAENCLNMVQSNDLFTKITGYILFSRIALDKTKFDNSYFLSLTENAPNDFEHEHYHVRISLSRALRNIAFRNEILKKAVLEKVEKLKYSKKLITKIIYEETAALINY